MTVKFLSAKNYNDPSTNNGDCILVDNGSELVIYDCGCEEHARQVVEYIRIRAIQMQSLFCPTTTQTTSTESLTLLRRALFQRFTRSFS